ncbi:5062_t:CDS:2 [Scutellospora calospora]|uniref:5062_t:CDS:1 n=1 Tax=Scutellospora calospora TaxID=85575 RepID=A0ACA9KBZ8_9GLOM|nr:5062_t:CDS:2 [Scutellospora calospora]
MNVFHKDLNPNIILPFPPIVNIDDFVKLKPDGTIPTKPINAFMIYRLIYQKKLQTQFTNVSMRAVSKIISDSWKKESEDIKEEYRKIQRAVEVRFSEKWPKSKHIFKINRNIKPKFEIENVENQEINYDQNMEITYINENYNNESEKNYKENYDNTFNENNYVYETNTYENYDI